MLEQFIKNIFTFFLTRNYDSEMDMDIEENKEYVKEIIHLLFD